MPVFLDVESRLDRRAVEATAREITQIFNRLGADVSRGLGGSLGKAWSAFDTSGARAQLLQLETAWRRAADVEVDAARRMEVAAARAQAAVAKYGEDSARAMQAQALAAKSQRDYADALVANEAAHKSHTRALQDSAAAASVAGRAWNAAGVGSLAVFTGSVLEATKKAGDFQQQMTKLSAAASVPADQLKTISDGVLKMAGQVGYSTTELNKAMFTISKMGYNAADGLKVLQAGAQGANAEQADLTEVIKALTLTMHNFNVPADKAAETMSKMVTAVGESGGSLQDFAGALHTIEPMANQLHLRLEDVWGTLAQMSKSGESFDQSADNMLNAMRSLSNAQGPARDAMQQLGLNADDISQHLGERGLAGTIQYLSDNVMRHFADANHVNVGEMRNAAQAQANLGEMFAKMSPYARQHAEALANNAEGSRAYTMAMRGANEQDKTQMEQARKLIDTVDGFGKRFASGRQTLETYTQAMNDLLGTTAGAQVAFQVSGDKAKDTNKIIQDIATTYTNADGTVKGFNESQDTLNAKLRDSKAAFGAAAIEIGSAFVPIMTDVANVAKNVGDEMAKHPGVVHAVIDAVGALGAAWLTFKAINIAETILAPVARGLGTIIAGEEGAAAGAARLSTSLSLVGTAAAGLAAAQAADNLVDQNPTLRDINHAGGGPTAIPQSLADRLGARTTRRWFHNLTGLGSDPDAEGHAAGGAVHGRGPNGIDSVHALLAPGEHVLTHHDVAAMGGHAGVYAFRESLHGGTVIRRQYGGAVGPDVQVAESMVGTAYSQGSRNDCSGMVGRVVSGALGISGGGLPTTKNMGQWLSALGFKPGIGGPGTISVGWYDHGPNPNDGHAAMTLSDGENAESGGSHGNFIVGAGAAGASSSQFDHHMFLPNLYGEGPGGGMPGMFGAGGMGGGGGAMGGGAGGGGYYSPNPQGVAAAQERLRHIDAEIATAEEKRGELKADAKKSERDRLDEEIRHLKEERGQAENKLHEAERGTFHRGRGGTGDGSPFLPVALPDKFGLGKGLPGVAEWAVAFLEDLVLGPMETAAMAGLGGMGDLGGIPGPGDAGFGAPGPIADLGGGAAGGGFGGAAPGGSGSSTGSTSPSTPSSWNDPYWTTKPATPAVPGPVPNAEPLPTDIGDQILRRQFLDAFKFQRTGPTHFDPNSLLGPGAPGRLFGPTTGGMRDQQLRDAFKKPPPPTPDQIKGLPGPWGPAHFAAGGQIPDAGGKWNQEDDPDPSHLGSFGWSKGSTNHVPWGKWGIAAQLPPESSFGGKIGDHDKSSQIPMDRGQDQHITDWWNNGQITINSQNVPDVGIQGTAFGKGPKGTDTVPAWLSPGEFVMNAKATKQFLPYLQGMNAQYFDTGSDQPVQQQPAPQAAVKTATPAPPGPQPQPGAQSGQGAQGSNGVAALGLGAATSGQKQGSSNLATPGAGTQAPGSKLPPSPGIGFSGGIIGAAEGAASSGANMFAPGAGAAAQIGFQELNRAAAAGAQAAGVGVEGLLETIIPSGSGTGQDWMQTIPGRLLGGIAGVRPSQPNSAGQTQLPSPGAGPGAQYGGGGDGGGQYSGMGQTGPGQGGIHLNGPITVQANNPQQFMDSLNHEANMAGATYAMSGNVSGPGGGR